MAKPTGGLLAFNARGSVAKTIVYSAWRGRPYVRQYVIPANPRSTSQQLTRSAFAWLQQVWKLSPTEFQDPWTLFAKGQPLTNRNAFGKSNISPLRTASDLSGFVFSPGAKGGLACTGLVLTPGTNDIDATASVPSAPVDWILDSVTFAVIADQDPNTGTLYDVQVATDSSAPYTVTFSGLTTAQLYWVGAWPVWTKPDGTLAYGPSIKDSATPT